MGSGNSNSVQQGKQGASGAQTLPKSYRKGMRIPLPLLLIILLLLVIFSVSDILVRSFQINMESNRRAAKIVLDDVVNGVNGKLDILGQGLVASPPRTSAEFEALLDADNGPIADVFSQTAFVLYFDGAWAPARIVTAGDTAPDGEISLLSKTLSGQYRAYRSAPAQNPSPPRFVTVGSDVFMLSTSARLHSTADQSLVHMVLGLPAEHMLRAELDRFEIFRSGALEKILNNADLADYGSIAQVIVELHQQEFEDFRLKTIAQVITLLAAFIVAVVIAHRIDEKNAALEKSHGELAVREQETARLRSIAERASIAKTNLIQNLSHELRTPLNGIMGYAELISTEMFGKLPGPLGRYRDYAESIHASGARLLNALSQILEYSDYSGGGVTLRQDPIDFARLLTASVDEFAASIKAKKITANIHIDPDLPYFRGDESVLAGLLRNLISNAVTFGSSGGKIEVEASTCPYTGGVQIKISDDGAGMEKQKVLELFQPFAQADDVYARENQGLGLGLALAKCYAIAHHGAISIDTEPGKGTRITVLFRPSKPADAKSATAAAVAAEESSEDETKLRASA